MAQEVFIGAGGKEAQGREGKARESPDTISIYVNASTNDTLPCDVMYHWDFATGRRHSTAATSPLSPSPPQNVS